MKKITENKARKIKKEVYEATKKIADKYSLNVWMPGGSLNDREFRFTTAIQIKE